MTIKEIANSLGVSTATVSNVIHGHLEKMSPETTQLVRKKLEQYQYIPNMGARMLAKGDSEIVGVITNYPNREEKFALQDPFVSEMIAALENAIRARGYYTMLRAAQTAAEIHRISQTWNAVGLIVMGLQANQCRELVEATRKPIVFVDCYFDEGEQYNNVGLDDLGGMRQLTETLLKLGHRNMLLVGGPAHSVGRGCAAPAGASAGAERCRHCMDTGTVLLYFEGSQTQKRGLPEACGMLPPHGLYRMPVHLGLLCG